MTEDGQLGSGRTSDPMSADRRVLVVAAISMLMLVLVGVVSAQLFARSACDALDPRPHGERRAGTDLEAVLADGLPDLDGPGREAVTFAIGTVEGLVGPVIGAADVRGADRLAIVDGEAAALGSVTTVLASGTTEVRATEDLADGTVVGDGDVLYSLALVNPLTGQVDALQPLDGDLEPGTCVDTATVGTPLAFHLDAGGGELLLLRTEEDGDEPAIELRDAITGSVWSTLVEVGVAPAGVLAERVDGRLGSELAVVGRRIAADDGGPAVLALDRVDGSVRWDLRFEELEALAPPGPGPLWPTILAAGGELALVALAREEDRAAANLVAVALDDGSVRWQAQLERPVEPLAAAIGALPTDGPPGGAATDASAEAGAAVWIAVRDGDAIEPVRLTPDGELRASGELAGPEAVVVHLDEDTAVFGAGTALLVSEPEGQHVVSSDAEVLDLASDGTVLHVLYGTAEGAVVVSFLVATEGG